MEDKAAIRDRVMALRRSVTQAERAAASESVQRGAMSLLERLQPERIHCYAGSAALGEIDTTSFIEEMRQLLPGSKIDISPADRAAIIPSDQYDAIIVPLVAFDRSGNRLGMGGGWYDSFLSGQQRAIKIGLAYTWAEVPDLTTEPHDVPLDYIVTDRESIQIRA